MPIFNISKVGSVNSGSDVISKVYVGPDLMYSAGSKGYLFRDFDPATGVLSAATGALEDASEITEIPVRGLNYGFNGCTGITGSASFPNLTSVSDRGMLNCFYKCTGITSISFPKLTSIGSWSMYNCFQYCTGLTSVSFPNLTDLGNHGMGGCFYNCTGITSISFPKLANIQSDGMYNCFQGCKGLAGRVDFPSLTSVANYGLGQCFSGTKVTEVHFKASLSGNKQCTAKNLGITGKVYFDL